MISAPFNGQTFADFYATISPYAIYQNPTGGQTKVLFGRFNNETGEYQNNDPSGTATMDAGEGFRAGSGIYKENFSSSSFYHNTNNNYLLNNHPKWGASMNWIIDNTNGTTHVSEEWKKSVLKHGFSGLSQGDKITARIELTIEGTDNITSNNFSMARFGFSATGTTGWQNTDSNFIFLSKIAGNLVVRDNGNSNLDTTPPNNGEFQTGSDELNNNYIYEVSLTIGADASSSTMSGNLINADNLSQETGEGIHNGLLYNGNDTGVYSAVTGSDGIYFIMQSQNISKLTSGKIIVKGLSLYVNDQTLPFTGTFETSNITKAISNANNGGQYERWNLIGNPFPSYLDLNHFFTDNTGNLESGATNGVYAYDGDDSDGSEWTIYNGNNSSGQYIAPGQAFFVASASGGHTIEFDTDMQSTAGTDDFLPGERRPNDDSFAQNASSSNSKISLALSFDDSKYAATDIYLNTKASSGLDVGYDAGTFANQAGSLGLYSFLADGSHPETKLAIQAVSNNISDPVVIPLGVNAQSGIDYTIKLKERPQQEGVFIYLKDKLDNSMTLLTDEDYSFNTSTDLQGDGRFEIHLSAFALSTFDISKAPYSMIGLSGKVQVTGELSKGDVITILDLRGRTLAKQTVNSPTQSATVQLNGVSKGVYVGKVENNIGQYNTKFILK